MKKRRFRRGAALMLSLMISINSITGYGPAPVLTGYADERPAQVKATTLNVRSGPGTTHTVVAKLINGTAVTVLNEVNGSDGMVWYQIRFSGSGGAESTGYARSDYIRFPATYSTDMDFEGYLTSQGFPESYKPGLRQLHALYPQWIFTAQHTNLDWNTVIENEALVGRNLVYGSSISSWKSTADGAYNWETSMWPAFDSGNYVAASDALIRYYMDPRNFLDDIYVFQFLLHSYDASAHTVDGLRSMVSGTFLAGSAAVSGETGTASGPVAGSGEPVGTQAPGGDGGNAEVGVGPGGVSSGGDTGTQAPVGNSGSAEVGVGPGGVSSGGNTGTQASAGNGGNVSTQAPSGDGGSGVSFQAPGTAASAGGNSIVSFQAPGTAASVGENSGVSLQAPGTAASVGENSGVSFQAPGTVASAAGLGGGLLGGRLLGAATGFFDTSRILLTAASLTGPTEATAPAVDYSAGPGVFGPADSLGTEPAAPSAEGTTDPSAGGEPADSSGAPVADYVDIIMNAGVQSGVNPYVLAAMILQEQGNSGTGRSISGTVSGYEGYYNFFNIEAYQSGSMDAVTRGLWYASQSGSYNRPWNSVDKAIVGGALHYGTNYVKVGQDTFYLKKFNVQGQNLYKHQYMTNVQAAASEGARLAEAYGESLKKTNLEFKIPVYLNMPAEACAKPVTDGSPNNKLSDLSVSGFSLTPTFSRDTASYDLIVDSSVAQVQVNASAYSAQAVISGAGVINLQSGINEIVISVTAQNGDVRQYVIHVMRQQNGPTGSGIPGSDVSVGVSDPGTGGTQVPDYSGGPGVYGPVNGGSSGESSSGSAGPGGSSVTIVQ